MHKAVLFAALAYLLYVSVSPLDVPVAYKILYAIGLFFVTSILVIAVHVVLLLSREFLKFYTQNKKQKDF